MKNASGLANVAATSDGRLKLVEVPVGIMRVPAVALLNRIVQVPSIVELVMLATTWSGLALMVFVFQSTVARPPVCPRPRP